MTTASANNLTLVIDMVGDCAHEFTVALGCEPHGYAHIWGWACSRCWAQVFYDDLEGRCYA